jgi:centromere protein J
MLNQTDNENDDDESDEDEFDLKFPQEYHGKTLKPAQLVEEIKSTDGKIQRFFDNGKKEVIFSNGVKREVWSTGYSVVYFANNDVKQTFPD